MTERPPRQRPERPPRPAMPAVTSFDPKPGESREVALGKAHRRTYTVTYQQRNSHAWYYQVDGDGKGSVTVSFSVYRTATCLSGRCAPDCVHAAAVARIHVQLWGK